MCVRCVANPSIHPAVLTDIERFIEENSQTLLQPRLLLQRPGIRNVLIFRICCIRYINVNQHFFVELLYKYKHIHISVTLPFCNIASSPLSMVFQYPLSTVAGQTGMSKYVKKGPNQYLYTNVYHNIFLGI